MTDTTGTIVVFGYGTVGRPIVALLAARGERVRVAQRNRPHDLPAGAGMSPATCSMPTP